MSRLDLGQQGTPLWLPAADTVAADHENCMGGGMTAPKLMHQDSLAMLSVSFCFSMSHVYAAIHLLTADKPT